MLMGLALVLLATRPGLTKPVDLPAPHVTADPLSENLNTDNLLILRVDLGQYILTDAMTGYLNGSSLLLPLSEFVDTLDFPIGVSPADGTANGWFIRENQSFSIDMNRGDVIINGKKNRFNPAMAAIFEDDIYVDVRMLSKWFPLDITFDLPNLLINIVSRQPLPIEQSLARDNRRKKLLAQRRQETTGYPEIPQPYQVISWPSSYSSMELSLHGGKTGNVKGLRQTTFWTADVGKLSADVFLNADDQTIIPQARLKLGRKDHAGELLGPAKATEFSMGDISTPQYSMVSRASLGRGVIVSNFPLDDPTEFDRITLDGDLPSGWEVELYRNEVLLDFRGSRADGRYQFDNVPLLFGVNVLRLSFFGPQGQTRDEIRKIRVGPDQIKPGTHHYRFAANQQETQTLIGKIDSPSNRDTQGKVRLFGEYETGITRNLSLSMNLSSIPLDGGHHRYATVSGRAVMGDVFGRLDVTRDLSKGWATRFGAQTAIKGVTVIAEHRRLFDFVSEQFASNSDPVTYDSNVRLEGTLNLADLTRLPFSVTTTQQQTEAGHRTTSVSNRLSTAVGAASISNSLKWTVDKPADAPRATTVNGTFLLGGRIEKVRLRGQLAYDVEPVPTLSSSSVSADWAISRKINASAGVNVDLAQNGPTTFSTGLSSTFDIASVGLNADYDTASNFNARLTLSFSSARDPRSNGLVLSSGNLAESGAMSVRVFLDANANGVYDAGDTPLPGIGFMAGRSELRQKTDEQGLAYVSGLDTYRAINLTIDKKTLDDPFWLPVPEGFSVTLRPGVAGRADFPVITTGEIDGTVYRRSGEWAKEVKDVVIQLVGQDGAIVKQVKSSYDGYYLMDYVRPGAYILRIDPDQIRRLKMADIPDQPVTIKGNGTVLSGIDFFLDAARTERSFRLRLITYQTRDEVQAEWDRLLEQQPDTFKGLKLMIEVNDRGGEDGAVYDMFTGPFNSRQQAETLCTAVRALRSEIWCNPMTVQVR